jgi:hypothetical protein
LSPQGIFLIDPWIDYLEKLPDPWFNYDRSAFVNCLILALILESI